jgi:protein-S-isoprenylcysteine O-methyltransferase Ste14
MEKDWSMKRAIIFAYGTTCYVISLATFVYAVGFVGNFAVPTTLDGRASGSPWTALAVNLGLLTAFALQHSVMARPVFKSWWTRIVPKAAERSIYVLFTCIALFALFAFWQPMGGVIWNVNNVIGQILLYGLFGFGWVIVLLATFLINHFDLFGLRQVWLELRGKQYTPLKFSTPWLYRHVRHPLYVGWLLVFWATPTMSAAHLVFALVTTAYILVAIQLEERDLVAQHGVDYEAYRKRVPMLIPSVFRSSERNRLGSAAPHGAMKIR